MVIRVCIEVQTVAEAVFVLKQAQAVPVEAGVLWGAWTIGPLVGLGGSANNNQRNQRTAEPEQRSSLTFRYLKNHRYHHNN